MTDTEAVVDDIAAGHHDTGLGKLFDALFARASETDVQFGWKLKVDGDEWNVETVTIAELAFAEQALSTGQRQVSYLELDPLRSMGHLSALIVAHLHKVGGLGVREAFARADQLTVGDLAEVVSAYEVKPNPKAADGPTPPGS